MANRKRVFTAWEQGKILYCVIDREIDNFELDFADGVFRATAANRINPLTADGTQDQFYKFDENRVAWDLGNYNVNIYLQSGGSPSFVDDILIEKGNLRIIDTGAFLPLIKDQGEYLGHATAQGMWQIAIRTVTGLQNVITGLTIDNDISLRTQDAAIEIFVGDTVTLTVTLGFNVTGGTTTFMMKRNIDDSDGTALVNRTMTVLDAVTGSVSIKLTAVENDTIGNMFSEINFSDVGVSLTKAQFRINVLNRVFD